MQIQTTEEQLEIESMKIDGSVTQKNGGGKVMIMERPQHVHILP